MKEDFRKCPYCLKLNPTRHKNCGWCGSRLPDELERWTVGFMALAAGLAILATIFMVLR